MQPIRASIRAASDSTFIVEGVDRVQVDIGGHVTIAVFRVVPKLVTKMILGMALFDKNIKVIETNTQNIVPKNGHAVAIAKSFEDEHAVQSITDAETESDNTGHTKSFICTVATKKTIPP